jgi:hypothetical protein
LVFDFDEYSKGLLHGHLLHLGALSHNVGGKHKDNSKTLTSFQCCPGSVSLSSSNSLFFSCIVASRAKPNIQNTLNSAACEPFTARFLFLRPKQLQMSGVPSIKLTTGRLHFEQEVKDV